MSTVSDDRVPVHPVLLDYAFRTTLQFLAFKDAHALTRTCRYALRHMRLLICQEQIYMRVIPQLPKFQLRSIFIENRAQYNRYLASAELCRSVHTLEFAPWVIMK
jgi:hypothetical protein